MELKVSNHNLSAEHRVYFFILKNEVTSTKPFDYSTNGEGGSEWNGLVNSDSTYLDSPLLFGSHLSYLNNWTPPSVYSSENTIPHYLESSLFALPTRSRISIDTTSTSLSSQESDDVAVVCVADDSPIIHVPPFYPTLQMGVNGTHTPSQSYDYYHGTGMSDIESPTYSKHRSSPRTSTKQKLLKYKTKPCKFYSTEKGCPNGSACTFMHDEYCSGTSSPAPMKHLKPLMHKDESGRRNYFPIPWRVIGGGVRVGVVEKDDKANLAQYSTDSGAAPSSLHPLPSRVDSGISPLKIITRQRSNSIPPTPSTIHFKVEHLFSAESPGVL
ncbi:hypothetical protein B0H34DRAFT_797611 [Crassisporium funariophilum]|nr:hypothetical protein B0H34DRAFT_797611 [Crassisporium funariophilum]